MGYINLNCRRRFAIKPRKRIVRWPSRRLFELLRIRAFLILLVVPLSSAALADINVSRINSSTVVVNQWQGRRIARSGSGYVVSTRGQQGFVITSAELVAGGDSITVRIPSSGAEMVAHLVASKPSLDLALLSVAGLAIQPYDFSARLPQPGAVVWTVVKWNKDSATASLVRGSLQKAWSATGRQPGYLRHDAAAGNQTVGSILINNCGQIVGFNLAAPGPNGNVKALDSASLATLLADEDVSVVQAPKVCVSQIAEAREQAAQASAEAKRAGEEAIKAQHVAQALERRLLASNKQNEALVAATLAARRRADEAIRKADIAHQNAESTRAELNKKTASIVRQTKAMMKIMEEDNARTVARFQRALKVQRAEALTREEWLVAVGLALVAGLLILILLLRRSNATSANENRPLRPKRAVSSGGTELHRGELTEYVLDGRDEDGIRYLLRISGDQLCGPDGVIIGRNPQDSPYIINHADVSRKHARMKVMKNRVFIEDLGSTNGTSVNGQSIDDKGPVSVVNGDQIIIGSVVMKLRVLGV